ncbi:MAG: metal-sensitive transcriptional regulator [Anaerolineales bacterium]|nr:metal-sensitive transcriptional regulator [Anaerolineales bacterium]MDW8162755.1 metal-sensitive transcriptional regulator [Anaerolineales bacterium]
MNKEAVLNRLTVIEGHLKGVRKMVEQEAYCMDVLHQIHAIRSALNKVSMLILDEHLNSCVISAIRSESPEERERVLKEIAELFETVSKP